MVKHSVNDLEHDDLEYDAGVQDYSDLSSRPM